MSKLGPLNPNFRTSAQGNRSDESNYFNGNNSTSGFKGNAGASEPKHSFQLNQRLVQGLSSGSLNLTSLGLDKVPDQINVNVNGGITAWLTHYQDSTPSNQQGGWVKDLRSWECYNEETMEVLDCSDNGGLQHVDEGVIESFSNVKKLRFKRCGISSFPFHSLSSPNLLILDLSFNALKGQLRIDGWGETLTALYLQGNHVTCLTVASGMANLNDLDVSSNALTSLEGLDINCGNLMKVNLSRNRGLSSLPNVGAKVRELDASSCGVIGSVALENCPFLTNLNLASNNVTKVEGLNGGIVMLDISDNSLRDVDGMWNVGGIEGGLGITEFRAADNELTSISPSTFLPYALNLTLFDVSNNSLNALPSTLGYLPELKIIKVNGNELRGPYRVTGGGNENARVIKKKLRFLSPPPTTTSPKISSMYLDRDGGEREEGRMRVEEDKRAAREGVSQGILDLSYKEPSHHHKRNNTGSRKGPDIEGVVASIGVTVTDYENDCSYVLGDMVHTLVMRGWGMERVDERIFGVMGKVRNLDLGGNRLSALPIEVSSLSLRTLNLSSNIPSSRSLSSSIGRGTVPFRTMSVLILSSCNLTSVPECVFGMKSIKEIDLGHNKIERLGGREGWRVEEGMGELTKLDLGNNRLVDLGPMPTMLRSTCSNLRTLNLSNNSLTSFPSSLGHLTQLTGLDLRGNPQRRMRNDIMDQGVGKILSWLRGREEERKVEEVGSGGDRGGGGGGDDLAKWEMEYDDNENFAEEEEEKFAEEFKGGDMRDTREVIMEAERNIDAMCRKIRHHHTTEREKKQLESMVRAEKERIKRLRE